MRRICLAVLALSFLALLVPCARAGEKAPETPTVVVRAKSLNALLENLNLVVNLVGQEEAARQIEGLIKGKIGKKGLKGIDPTRPFGAYVRFGKTFDEINGAILIPIADEESVLTLLDNLGAKYKKDKQGIYTHKANNIDYYFRFARKYLCITAINTESLEDKNLPDPAKVLAISGDATITLIARIDQIPNDVKAFALPQLEESILAAKKKKLPNETKIQEAFRIALLDDVHKLAKGMVLEAAEVRFDLDIADKTKEMTVNFSLKAIPGSNLAKSIKDLDNLKSPLVGMVNKDLAFQGAAHLILPSGMNKALGGVIDEVVAKSLEGIQDKDKKKQAETLFKALMPTAKAGEYHLVAAVVGPKDDRFTFVAALKLTEGDKLGKTVHELITDALKNIPEENRSKIQLDFDNVGAVKIHKFEIPKNAKIDKLLEDIAGANHLYLAFRDDAMFLALGKEALATLKSAVAKKDSAASQPLLFDFDVARMAKLMAQTEEQKDLAAKLFPDGANGRLRLVVEGGESLRAHMQIRLNVLEFLVKMKNEK